MDAVEEVGAVLEAGEIDHGDSAFDVADLSLVSSDDEDDGALADDNDEGDESDTNEKEPEQNPSLEQREVRDSDGEIIFTAVNKSSLSRKRKRKNSTVSDDNRKRKKYRSAREVATSKKTGLIKKGPKHYVTLFKNDHLSATLQGLLFVSGR
jgi:hypothetical protein